MSVTEELLDLQSLIDEATGSDLFASVTDRMNVDWDTHDAPVLLSQRSC